ncbi:MAG TPA: helix-hairpin-helix domain-containing protein [Methanobacteriaceae archaeon]|nr:helix-hairpin-helix domain-containing protein [Methanobacteriaceae archaeon]
MKKQTSDLQKIPGIGPSMEVDLQDLGINTVDDLNGQDPEDLYNQLILQRGSHIDRCVLYVFRCAVYYAEKEEHDPELLKWWNWKDK